MIELLFNSRIFVGENYRLNRYNHLRNNQLNGSIPVEFGNLIDLKRLYLSGNQLNGNIPATLGNLVNLETLDLATNQLSGNIPGELNGLSNLRILELSGNQLSGSIPPGLGALTNLTRLWLFNNQLSGEIPMELGNLINLTSLFLSSNQLSGCFPESLSIFCGVNYAFNNNLQLPWQGDFERFCNNEDQIGASCDDGDPNTENDVITADCGCAGSGSSGLLLSVAVYLQGAYELTNGLMRDILRLTNVLPLEEPYAALGFTHVGGGGEAISPAVLAIEGMDAIVDWVFLELRDPSNHSLVIATRSALLQRDGDVVEVDGVSPVVFENATAGDYYLSVKHRNHLGVMSAEPATFLNNTPAFIDFTGDLNKTFGAANGIANLSDGNLGLYSGDFNHNGQVQNTDYNDMVFSLGTAGYAAGDFDLNGQVQNTDLQLKLIPNIGRGQPFGQ